MELEKNTNQGLVSGETLGKDAETNVQCCYCLKVPLGFFIYGILTVLATVGCTIKAFSYMDQSFVYGLLYILCAVGPGVGIVYFVYKQRTSADDYEGRMNLVKACNIIIA